MLTGHAYARALRAHILTQAALAIIFLSEIKLDEDTQTEVRILHDAIMNQKGFLEDLAKNTMLTTILER